MSNFTYCPLVWHFCGKKNNGKIENIQERALRIVYSDYTSEYQDLIKKLETTTMLQSRHNCILSEVFKSLKQMNPTYIQNLFSIKDNHYSMRDSLLLVQPKKETTNFGLRTISYLGSRLWNELPCDLKNISDTDISVFKSRLKQWKGANLDNMNSFYV